MSQFGQGLVYLNHGTTWMLFEPCEKFYREWDNKQLMDLKEKIVRELSSVNRVSEINLLLSLHSSGNIEVVSNHIAEMWIPQEWKKMKFAALR